MEKEPSSSAKPENPEEEIRIIDGKKYRRVESGYTIRQFFSHSTPEKGPGPGWDTRTSLLDDEYAMRNFGRTFTMKEVFNPSQLPDAPYYDWELIGESEK
ncbi:MAG: hypothetical protein G01um101419_161 [Parcubacteria group bacterium Gr01-1014_19]|nr:MAG: hypothetical protein G01um101419_161 [Parcubacteria group bacterium Gr01-1014_19]